MSREKTLQAGHSRGPEVRKSQLCLGDHRGLSVTRVGNGRGMVGTNRMESKVGPDAGRPREQLALKEFRLREGKLCFDCCVPQAKWVTSRGWILSMYLWLNKWYPPKDFEQGQDPTSATF